MAKKKKKKKISVVEAALTNPVDFGKEMIETGKSQVEEGAKLLQEEAKRLDQSRRMNKETRRQMKKRAWRTLKGHYFLLVLICLAAMYIGIEFNLTTTALNYNDNYREDYQEWQDRSLTGEMRRAFETLSDTTAGQVFLTIVSGNLQGGTEAASQALEDYKGQETPDALGRTNGVLASMRNVLFSGQLFVTIAEMLYSIIKSGELVGILMILVSFALYMWVFIFIRAAMGAVVRRAFLEARSYERVPINDLFHMGIAKRWGRGSRTLFITYLFQSLWNLTIIGGIIKYFSYFLVPYIVAENPDIKPMKAIHLSTRMMKGHKWELFLYQMSFLGWRLLSLVTFSFSDIFWGFAYRQAGYAEYYARMRFLAKAKNMEDAELLNDRWLYSPAGDRTLRHAYSDLVDDELYLATHKVPMGKTRSILANWFGVWIGKDEERRVYQEGASRRYLLEKGRDALKGKCYPMRLNPLCGETLKVQERVKNAYFMRCYTPYSLIMLFLAISMGGWIWEVVLHYIQAGEFVNRGALHGPWLPIYGAGGILALTVINRLRNKPVATMFATMTMCGIVEYLTSYIMEMKNGIRWWDYTGYFLNLNGRICAEGLLLFGIGGMAVIYVAAPLFDSFITRIKKSWLVPLSIGLMLIFTLDWIYSGLHPNMGAGITEGSVVSEENLTGDGSLS